MEAQLAGLHKEPARGRHVHRLGGQGARLLQQRLRLRRHRARLPVLRSIIRPPGVPSQAVPPSVGGHIIMIWLLRNLVEASFDLFRYLLLSDQLKPWELHPLVSYTSCMNLNFLYAADMQTRSARHQLHGVLLQGEGRCRQ